MKEIVRYFPNLSERQIEQFAALRSLYEDWNSKINVISRKDIDNFYLHHVLHSLSIAKVVQFKDMCEVLDVGTGGGFPGVPLAIMFPRCHFTLVDSIGKKITVVKDVIEKIGITNAEAMQTRAEELDGEYDFIVSRAVTSLERFIPWVKDKVEKSQYHSLHNGILYLKGGDVEAELKGYKKKSTIYPISNFFEEEYFLEKYVVHIPM